MYLLNFPIEIRFRIYSELLVQESPVEFGAALGPCDPRLFLLERQDLNPAILRVSKTVNGEAAPFLYLNNHFRFPTAYTSSNTATYSMSEVPYIAPFLRQIGSNADLLRRISINFPVSFVPGTWENPVLREEDGQVLQHIRETCSGLRTVEISCMPSDCVFSLDDLDLAEKMLRALDDGGFRDMCSLEKIVVISGQYGIDEDVIAIRESLKQRMPSSKWSIELTLVPPRVWVSIDDRVEFDNEEDCDRYNDEVLQREYEREERLVREQWLEEYYHRRDDPFWKNDSDYD